MPLNRGKRRATHGTRLVLSPVVLLLVFFLAALAFVAFKVTTPEERERGLEFAKRLIAEFRAAEALNREACKPFDDSMRERATWALVAHGIAALMVMVFVAMVFGKGSVGDPATLIGWGGSYAPLTTNGQWWRLVTALFVHASIVTLLVNAAVLVQAGRVVERMVGRAHVAAVFLAAGLFSGLMNLSAEPLKVGIGASGSLFGLYGLLIAAGAWAARTESPLALPRARMIRMAPLALIFLLTSLFSDALTAGADLTGLIVGIVGGLVLARNADNEEVPHGKRVVVATVATLVIAAVTAVPLRGVTDARPEVLKLVALEERTAAAFKAADEQMRKRKMTASALANMIEGTILPELDQATERVASLDRVPEEHQPLVEGSRKYLDLRTKSWRMRADGLRRTENPASSSQKQKLVLSAKKAKAKAKPEPPVQLTRRQIESQHVANLVTLGSADAAEHTAIEVLAGLKPVAEKSGPDDVMAK
jgi:rhomboid protease GluP